MSDAAPRNPGTTAVSAETDLDENSLDVRLAGGPGPVDPADVVAADAAAREFVARATNRPLTAPRAKRSVVRWSSSSTTRRPTARTSACSGRS